MIEILKILLPKIGILIFLTAVAVFWGHIFVDTLKENRVLALYPAGVTTFVVGVSHFIW